MTKTIRAIPCLIALVLVVLTAAPAAAAEPTPLMGDYWYNFVDWWTKAIRHQNGVVLLVCGAGAIGLAIIMSAKKKTN